MDIFNDIETIPGQKPGLKEAIAETISPPGNMKKAETIAHWEAYEKPVKIEEAYRKTALSGATGEIICISWAFDNGAISNVIRGLDDSEADMLNDFFKVLAENTTQVGEPRRLRWIGHNVKDFDLRFMYQRAIILGVRPPVPLPHNARPGSPEVFDTMTEWAGFRNTVKLDTLCQALGIPGKDDSGMDGSQVWDRVQAGELAKVASYCDDDVDRVRQLFRRMNFIEADNQADQILDMAI